MIWLEQLSVIWLGHEMIPQLEASDLPLTLKHAPPHFTQHSADPAHTEDKPSKDARVLNTMSQFTHKGA